MDKLANFILAASRHLGFINCERPILLQIESTNLCIFLSLEIDIYGNYQISMAARHYHKCELFSAVYDLLLFGLCGVCKYKI